MTGTGTAPRQADRMTGQSTDADGAPRRVLRFDPTPAARDNVYGVAARHSRRVGRLKVALPVLAIVGVVGFLAYPTIATRLSGEPAATAVSLDGINTETKSMIMSKPHISGFDGTRQAYVVDAEKAVQDVHNPKMVTLTHISGSIGTGDGGTAKVDAGTGVFDTDAKKLQLKDGITIATTSGYSLSLQEALIDMASGVLQSDQPVDITSTNGRLRANTMMVTNRGKTIAFKNGVSLYWHGVISPGNAAPDASDEAAPDAVPPAPVPVPSPTAIAPSPPPPTPLAPQEAVPQ
jgi:lipopolysaccharide export system protein LptC